MNRIIALIIAGSLLLTAVAPVAAINDGTSNTRSGPAAPDCATAGNSGVLVGATQREAIAACIVPWGDFPAPPAT